MQIMPEEFNIRARRYRRLQATRMKNNFGCQKHSGTSKRKLGTAKEEQAPQI